MTRPIRPFSVLRRQPERVRDRPSRDPVARAVQIGLLIYLSPVIALVLVIGGVSVAAQATGHFVFGAIKAPGRSLANPAADLLEAPDPRARRGRHRAHPIR